MQVRAKTRERHDSRQHRPKTKVACRKPPTAADTGFRFLDPPKAVVSQQPEDRRDPGVRLGFELNLLLRAQFEKSESELLDEFLSGTQNEVLGRVADAERIYDLAAELLELPADQFDAAYSALEKEAEAAGPLTAYWLRDTRVKIMRDREVEAEAKMTMLRAALAMAADGSGALERFPDPFGDGPFALTRDDESFELKSKLVIDRKPVQLRFRRPLP